MILVFGATGRIGGEVARLLASKGAPVRALVRDQSKAGALAGQGIELTAGDLDDVASLEQAMKGVERVFLVSAHDLRQAELQGNAVDAAVRSGVLSRLGVLAAPMADVPIAMVDARDIAAVAATVLSSDTHHERVYDVSGPRAFTYQELATILADATDRSVRYVDLPPAMATAALRRQGHPEWYVDHVAQMAALFRAGAGATVSSTVSDVTGQPPRTIESFATEHSASFTRDGLPLFARSAAQHGLALAARAASLAS